MALQEKKLDTIFLYAINEQVMIIYRFITWFTLNKLWKAKREREKAQYGISMSYGGAEDIVKDARDFASKIKLVMADMDEKITEELTKKVKELKNSS